MKSPILFNHIPRTGGTTLRIILNRVYGEEHVFFIRSTDIKSSLNIFKGMAEDQRKHFKVVSGHGALLFLPYLTNPFKIAIIREPLSLFLSQYYYLKSSPNSNFRDEVSKLPSFDAYIDYATERGQDNMLTRFLAGEHDWLIKEGDPPSMEKKGDQMLIQAKSAMDNYNALLDLDHFDRGIYALSKMLGWKKIPLFRTANKGSKQRHREHMKGQTRQRLNHVLRYDISLYEYFKKESLDISEKRRPDAGLRTYLLRQQAIESLAVLMSKR